MSEFMTCLYTYVMEHGMMAYIDQSAYAEARRKELELSKALCASLSETDLALLGRYMESIQEVDQMETEAIFTAAISLGKELR